MFALPALRFTLPNPKRRVSRIPNPQPCGDSLQSSRGPRSTHFARSRTVSATIFREAPRRGGHWQTHDLSIASDLKHAGSPLAVRELTGRRSSKPMILAFRFRSTHRAHAAIRISRTPVVPGGPEALDHARMSIEAGCQNRTTRRFYSQLYLAGPDLPPTPRSNRPAAMVSSLTPLKLARSQNAGSDVKCPLPGDLNRLFYRVDVHFKSSSNVGIRDPRFDFTRVLCGEIQEQDRSIDLRLCPRMQAPDPRRPVLNGRACAPRHGSAAAPGPGLEIDDVCH